MNPRRINLRRTAASLLLAATALVVPGTANASPGDWARFIAYQIENVNSGKCLGFGWRPEHGWGDHYAYRPEQHTCGNEFFYLYREPSNTAYPTLSIRPSYEGEMCLEVENYSTANLADIGLHACTGVPTQQWQQVPSGYTSGDMHLSHWLSNSYTMRNVWSGKCLEVYAYSTANGAPITQYDCHAGFNQLWLFTALADL